MIAEIDNTPEFPTLVELSTPEIDARFLASFIFDLWRSYPSVTLNDIFEGSDVFPMVVEKHRRKGGAA